MLNKTVTYLYRVSVSGVVLGGVGLLVLGYVIPGLSHRRELDAQVSAEDRFSDQIRIVTSQSALKGADCPSSSVDFPLHFGESPARLRDFSGSAGRVSSVNASKFRKGVGMSVTSTKKQTSAASLAAALSNRAQVHGRLAAQAQRRVVGLGFVLALLLPATLILVLTQVTSAWWILLPVALTVLLLVQGHFAAAAGKRELEVLNAQISSLRSRMGASRGHMTPAQIKAERLARAEGESVSEPAVSVSEAPVIAPTASRKPEVERPVVAPSVKISTEVVVEDTDTVESEGWQPTVMPKPLYTMRATRPRREVMELSIDQPGQLGRVPVRPVRARRPQTGALSSAEVAAGAALEFDVDSVIEQRRAVAS